MAFLTRRCLAKAGVMCSRVDNYISTEVSFGMVGCLALKEGRPYLGHPHDHILTTIRRNK